MTIERAGRALIEATAAPAKVLAFHEVGYERTHSIGYLTSLLEHHGIAPPKDE